MAPLTHRSMAKLAFSAGMVWVLFDATSAPATVLEPSGLQVPIPEAQSSDLGWDSANRYRVDTVGLQHMLDAWEGAGVLDAQIDASATNVVFSPLCGLNGGMILRGGSCQVDFGWYCTSDAVGAEVIHPLVTKADIVRYHDVTMLSLPGTPPPPPNTWGEYANNDKGFVPTIQMGQLQPVVASSALADVRSSAEFQACASQQIGFAFQGNATSICPMSKFSEPSRNQMSTFGAPWVNAVVYESKATPGRFYIAFEDMPTSASSFTPYMSEVAASYPSMTGSNGWTGWKNDGDFNDFVFFVDGILCQGGGQTCTPTDASGNPLLGACSLGVTACSTDGTANGVCNQLFQSTAETCDGWDNDCNGVADDGDGLCEAGYVCDNGECVGSCSSGEFACDNGYVCESSGRLSGYCVKSDCAGIECDGSTRCVAGACVGGCEGVTCPDNTQCVAGSCIDLCNGITCPDNYVCERGACIPNCTCLPCTDVNETCDTTAGSTTYGRCIDPKCIGVTCGAYLTCVAGACVDPCASSPCGTNACVAAEDGSFSCPNGSNATDTGTSTGSLTANNDTTTGTMVGQEQGCGCRVAANTKPRQLLWISLLGFSLFGFRARRRVRRS